MRQRFVLILSFLAQYLGHPFAALAQATSRAAAPSPPEGLIDIYGPLPVRGLLEVLYYVLAALMAAAAVAALIRYFTGRTRSPAPVKTPEELALELLEAARRIMDPQSSREFSFALSEPLRTYIEARFGGSTTAETTEEFLRRLSDQIESPLSEHREMLSDFLRRCDAAKFARVSYDHGGLEDLYFSARRFIEAVGGAFASKEGKPAACAVMKETAS